VKTLEEALEPELKSFGKGFTVLENKVETTAEGIVKEVEAEEQLLVKEVEDELQREALEAQRLIRRLKMEASMGSWVKAIPLPIREIIMPVR